MDINSSFILSDVNFLNGLHSYSELEQAEQNLRFHILTPEEKATWNEKTMRTACKVHLSITKNLYLYAHNPSSGKLLKKITAEVFILPACLFEFLINVPNAVVLVLFCLIKGMTHRIKSSIKDTELNLVKFHLDRSKDPMFLGFIESCSNAAWFFHFLFSNNMLPNAVPGIKIHNKTLNKDEYMINLAKLECLKKYYGWDDATEQEIQTFLEENLKESRAVIEYEIKDGKCDWNHIKFSNPTLFMEKWINKAIEEDLLKNPSKWILYS